MTGLAALSQRMLRRGPYVLRAIIPSEKQPGLLYVYVYNLFASHIYWDYVEKHVSST